MPQLFFELGNLLIMPFWLSMMVAPGSKWTARLLAGPWMVAVLAALYGVLVLPHAAELLPLLANPKLDAIAGLLGTPLGAAAGWLHFLCFDLFVGRWIWMDARERNFSLWLLRPILGLTLMFGPLGLLSYFVARRRPWGHRPLLGLAGAMLVLLPICLLGLALDDRIITGLAAWFKPLKFALSVLIYALTLEAILKAVGEPAHAGKVRLVTTVCLTIEMAIVVLQTLRGTTSHFNTATPLDGFLFAVMGLAIVPVWLAAIGATWLVFRQGGSQPGLNLALRWGLLVAVVGMGVGWPMTSMGSHTVGAPDGGPGLPVLGWSTIAGDLRVPHFVGMHAIQVLPLLWLLLHRRVSPSGLTRLLHWSGFAYLVWVALLTHQALQGQSAFALGLPLAWPVIASLPVLRLAKHG